MKDERLKEEDLKMYEQLASADMQIFTERSVRPLLAHIRSQALELEKLKEENVWREAYMTNQEIDLEIARRGCNTNAGIAEKARAELASKQKEIEILKTMQSVPYQLCPMCHGNVYVWANDGTSITKICPVCNGHMKIPQHIIFQALHPKAEGGDAK